MNLDPTGQNFWNWLKKNWGKIVTALVIIVSVALILTGVGAGLGLGLLSIGIGAGGLLGVGASIASQLLATGSVDWNVVAIDGLFGMASGAIGASGWGIGIRIALGSAAGALGSLMGDLAENDWERSQINWAKVGAMGIVGAIPIPSKVWIKTANQATVLKHGVPNTLPHAYTREGQKIIKASTDAILRGKRRNEILFTVAGSGIPFGIGFVPNLVLGLLGKG